MTITFFKQDEFIAENNLMSVPQGEERLAACNAALFDYFDYLANNINNSIKSVIAGWRRGYSPEAVADYLFEKDFNAFADKDLGIKDTSMLLHSMYSKMGYDTSETYWGVQYGYTPSLEERDTDPLDVQGAINVRAQGVGKTYGYETIYFGQYHNNAGAVRSKEELSEVSEFRADICKVLSNRQAQFFTVTTEDAENV